MPIQEIEEKIKTLEKWWIEESKYMQELHIDIGWMRLFRFNPTAKTKYCEYRLLSKESSIDYDEFWAIKHQKELIQLIFDSINEELD